MTTDSTDTDASRARYKMKKSSCVSDRTGALRGLFVVSMAAAVAVCTTVAFVIIRNLQKQIGVQTYERYVWNRMSLVTNPFGMLVRLIFPLPYVALQSVRWLRQRPSRKESFKPVALWKPCCRPSFHVQVTGP